MRATVIALLLAAAAGQLLWGQRQVPFYEDSRSMPVSPEVHADRRVTFRFLAPKAQEVLLAGGNLQEALNGAQKMTKDEKGVWSLTVGPLDPGLYDYGFAVDGGIRAADPANRNVIDRTWGHTNYFEVPGERPQVHSVRPVAHGALHIHTYDSKALGVTRQVYVYTPPGYDASGETRYPVLYLFHGSGGVESQWTTVGRANIIMDNLIADAKARPMVVVMPYGHVPQTNADGSGRTASAGFDKDLIGDIVPLVESSYHVYTDRENRAVAGLSMGGGQSLAIGLGHLDLFSYVASFSGAVRDLSAIEKIEPADLNKKLKVFWIGCGKADFLFEANERLVNLLKERNVRHIYRVSEGGHTWPNWRLYLSEFAPLLFHEGNLQTSE